MQVLALDFDGVISDSAPESFAVALATYVDVRPEAKLAEARDRLVPGAPSEAWSRQPIENSSLFRDFLALMPLGNRAEDYAVVLSILEAGADVRTQSDYDVHYRSWSKPALERFHTRFYQIRHAFTRNAPSAWRALMRPYPELVKLLQRRGRERWLAIATAKDRESVDLLLRDYQLRDLISDDHVVDKRAGVSKRAHLEEIQRRSAAPFSHITFVDDKLNHLEHVRDLGVRCVLAAWGYNGEREQLQARRLGLEVCSLEAAERVLFDVS
jgi:phosphoglycolate phosphatase-like HAD superfamily hydrolase